MVPNHVHFRNLLLSVMKLRVLLAENQSVG
jgi:hypothetical protein